MRSRVRELRQPAEEFECVHCYSGIYSRYHQNLELPSTLIWERRGIFKSNSENKFLNNATSHAIGIQYVSGSYKEGYLEVIIKDQDGDMIVSRGAYEGIFHVKGYKLEFRHGTGKYENIKGSYITEMAVPPENMLEDLQKFIEKQPPWNINSRGVFKRCRLWKGTFELPPK